MGRSKEITDIEFESEVIQSKTPVLVDFWAPWCGPCKMIEPVMEELAKEYEGKVRFTKVNVDENPLTASKFGIRAIPSILVFKGGKAVKQVVGAVPKGELKKYLEAVVA
ncbi:MAG: thioredoxin [Dehalococcoidia bacterium]|nr:thioredoxin [Dehalococcoidia bacterium]